MDILDLMEREGTLMHQRELDYFLATHERASRFVLWHTAGAGALLLAGYGQPFAALVAAQGAVQHSGKAGGRVAHRFPF